MPSEINHLTDKKSLFQPLYCTVNCRDVCVSPPPLSSLSSPALIREHGTSTTFMKPFWADDSDLNWSRIYFWVVWRVFCFLYVLRQRKSMKIHSNHFIESIVPACVFHGMRDDSFWRMQFCMQWRWTFRFVFHCHARSEHYDLIN